MIKKSQKSLPSFNIEFDREEDGRWIAEISRLPGVMAYGNTKQEAVKKVYGIALRTLADKVDQGNIPLVISRLFKHEMAHR